MADDEKPAKPEKGEGKAKAGEAKPKEKKKGNPLMMIFMILGGLVVLAGASLAVIFMVIVPKLKTAEGAGKDKGKVAEAAMGPVFEVKDLVINSADTDALHYFKVGVAFELKNAKDAEDMKARDPVIRDLLITEMSQHTVADLNSREGREKMRKELVEKLKPRLGADMVKNLFFTEYVAQ